MEGNGGPIAVASGLIVGLLISGFPVWSASAAAFTATTANPGNRFHSGGVTLTDNGDGSTAMFASSTAKLISGTPVAECIRVKYVGDVNTASAVRLYGDATKVPGAAAGLANT